jgi:hypothetical protein
VIAPPRWSGVYEWHVEAQLKSAAQQAHADDSAKLCHAGGADGARAHAWNSTTRVQLVATYSDALQHSA